MIPPDGLIAMIALDIALIYMAAECAGFLLRRLGQPRVIGEIAAGIALGPTLLGALPGDPSATLFPAEARPVLAAIGHLGLAVFMFLIGLEFNARAIRRRRLVVLTGTGSAVVPFLAGLAIAPVLFAAYPPPAGVGGVAFALFIGVAVSITAFPVLARILQERGLDRTPIGTLTMAAAAVNDVLGWALLAVVLGLVSSGSPWTGPAALAATALFAVALVVLVRPVVGRVLARHARPGASSTLTTVALAGTFACAFTTELMGTHLIFGAFLFGIAWPHHASPGSAVALRRTLEPLTLSLFLPIFFVLPGLSLNLRELDGAGLAYLPLVLGTAVAAKIVGAGAGSRLAGLPLRSAVAVGALMNTRGLMELIVLNIGFTLGVLDGALYTVLVAMAIVTTVMTDPLIRWLRPPVEITVAPLALDPAAT